MSAFPVVLCLVVLASYVLSTLLGTVTGQLNRAKRTQLYAFHFGMFLTITYLVLPAVQVPRAARRAGESGVVWLRVLVDVNGLPAQVQLYRSSGHARLDEQALWAMRQARFRPQSENGRAIELEVIAPIDYPLE